MPGYFRAGSHDPATEMAMREEFVRALTGRPDWALQRAFDAWFRIATHLPSPGHINALIDSEIIMITAELTRRKRDDAARIEAPKRVRMAPEDVARIMAEVGMTPERLAAVEAGK